MTQQSQTCPRRMQEFGPWPREEGQDAWMSGAVGPSCSFCGSLHPDRFMELVREGWIVGPTDKGYKAYLMPPATDEEKAQHKERWLAGFTTDEVRRAAEEQGETPEQYRAELQTVYERQVAPLNGSDKQVKFYYQHLSEEQRGEFIDLHNNGRMMLGSPGHFYQPPFFTRPATSSPNQNGV